jgi:chaperonin GroEL (HSP60 family)
MNFDNGFVNNGFITDTARNCAELERPYVLVTNHQITNIRVCVCVRASTFLLGCGDGWLLLGGCR